MVEMESDKLTDLLNDKLSLDTTKYIVLVSKYGDETRIDKGNIVEVIGGSMCIGSSSSSEFILDYS